MQCLNRSFACLALALTFLIGACGDNSHATSSAKEFTAFAFRAADNPALSSDISAIFSGSTLAATVPFGTDVSALKATFTSTGKSVLVGSTVQVTGVTANNFHAAVDYTVVAADATTKDYMVSVTVAPAAAKDITDFAFLAADNTAITADVTATVNGTAITATVPFGTVVTALTPTFATTGVSVSVNATAQVSGTTADDFTAPVDYQVTAADQTTKTYTVTVTVAPSSAKSITAFSFRSVNNSQLTTDVIAVINGTSIAATVPYGTNPTSLIATFTTTGQSVTVGATTQVSGTTTNNFTNPVSYVVAAADATTKTYTVTVTVAANPAKDITSFKFTSALNGGAGISTDVVATISGTAISATVPYGTNVTALVATFATTGQSVAVGATTQSSGVTANNFSTDLTYKVMAADSTTKNYTVHVAIAANPAKDITSFSFTSTLNSGAGVTADAIGVINGQSIAVTVPYGTTPAALIATFTTTGQSVAVGATAQTSGVTANNFTNPITYTVTAADTTTKNYTVTLTIAANPAKDITAFKFTSALNSGAGISTDVVATVSGTNITATVPYGTNVSALVATFATTGASVTVGSVTQASGSTANNFATPVTYTVTAADSTTKSYTVTVTVALNPAKDLTSFSFQTVNNSGLASNAIGTITGTAIAVTLTSNISLSSLIATFTTTGATVSVGGVTQSSAVTANDFTSPVSYLVTAADGSTQTYTVTVKVYALLATATRTIKLSVVTTGAPMTVAYNPNLQLYYTGYGGGSSNAAYVFSSTGGAPTQSTTIDLDTRSFLWNGTTQQIEVCPFNVLNGGAPYSRANVDVTGQLLGTHTSILASIPSIADTQSSPAYDASRNVLYSRATGNVVNISKRLDGSSAGTVTLDYTTAGITGGTQFFYQLGYDPLGDDLVVVERSGTVDRLIVFRVADGSYVGQVALDMHGTYIYYNGNVANGMWFEWDGSGWQGYKFTN
jgi:hypothetical protein